MYRRAVHQRIFRGLISIFFVGPPMIFAAVDSSDEGWKLAVVRETNVAIYSRARRGSPIKEFKAIGAIDASTSAVCAVIDDFQNYPKFMPFMTECRVIKKDGDSIVGYQRLSPKICADRDYTLRVWKKSWPVADGVAFMSQWSPANELGPPEKKGVVRVKICEGKWLLEPEGTTKTRATYSVYTDSGGFLPSFIANHVSVTGITRLFAAIRKQVKDPRYAASISKGTRAPIGLGETTNGKNDNTRMTNAERSTTPQ
jgi:hypothetical protein